MGFVYVSRGFNRFQLNDLFTNEMVDVSEQEFEDIIVKHRSLFTLKYFSNYQEFYDENNHLVGRRFYL